MGKTEEDIVDKDKTQKANTSKMKMIKSGAKTSDALKVSNTVKASNISNTLKGKVFEDKAVAFLEEKGYEILERNSRFHHLEMDLVAKDERSIALCRAFMRWIERNKSAYVTGPQPIFVNMAIL